jgi:hypothetical protein
MDALEAIRQILRDLGPRSFNQPWVQIRAEQRAAFEKAAEPCDLIAEAHRIVNESIADEEKRNKVIAALVSCKLKG